MAAPCSSSIPLLTSPLRPRTSAPQALKEIAGCGDDRDAISRLVSKVAQLESAAAENESRRRRLQNEIIELKGNIRVFCRVRPSTGAGSAIQCMPDGATIRVSSGGKDHPFSFDKVFGPQATQESVFGEVSELVQSALDGYKVCLFSYGQTGAGKTHTMQGGSGPQSRGIIPRAIDKILEQSQRMRSQGWEYRMEARGLADCPAHRPSLPCPKQLSSARRPPSWRSTTRRSGTCWPRAPKSETTVPSTMTRREGTRMSRAPPGCPSGPWRRPTSWSAEPTPPAPWRQPR